ncbi:histone deacetylase, partial [Plakobranchus ocellatus]
VFLEQQQLQQKKLDQQRLEKEMLEQERLEQIKNKTKDEESAIASSAVKLKLQEFVLTKKHREAVVKDLNNSPPQFRHHWVPNTGSLDQGSPPLNLSPPYAHHLMAKYDDDFPLRKTAVNASVTAVDSVLAPLFIHLRVSALQFGASAQTKHPDPLAQPKGHSQGLSQYVTRLWAPVVCEHGTFSDDHLQY